MGFVATLDEPFLLSPSAASLDSPGLFPISIDGHPYMADTSFEPYRRDAFRWRTLPSQRTSADVTNIPGEATINTEGLWRREQQDWRGGSGQLFFDRKDSDPTRFRTSKGVNPWFPWQLTNLPATTQIKAVSDTTCRVRVVGAYLYVMTSTTLQFSTDLSSWTTVTGLPTGLTSMTTDGYDLWIATSGGTNAIYSTTAGAASASVFVTWTGTATTGGINVVTYCGGRLMCAGAQYVWNITSSTGGTIQTAAGPTATTDATGGVGYLFSYPNTNWAWNSFTAGEGQVYMAGFSGNVSEIYRTQSESNGVSLQVPILSAPMPRGEIVYSLYGYLNFVLVGTSAGARFCETLNANDPSGNAGDLKLGAIVPDIIQPMSSPCRCFTGQNEFVWFGWSNYDTTSTGIGRMDLSNFVAEFTPAYASDLMVTTQGAVTSMDWFGTGTTFNGNMTPTNGPVFVVQGVGVYGPSSNLVAGTVDGGYYTFGLPDNKVAMIYDVKPQLPLVGSYSASLSADQGTYSNLGTLAAGNTIIPFSIPQTRGEYLEPQLTLTPSGTSGPTILRTTLKAFPAVVSSMMISAVLVLWEQNEVNERQRYVNAYTELNFIMSLWQTQKVVVYQEGPVTVQVTVDSFDWLPFNRRDDNDGGYNGDLVVYLKSISS